MQAMAVEPYSHLSSTRLPRLRLGLPPALRSSKNLPMGGRLGCAGCRFPPPLSKPPPARAPARLQEAAPRRQPADGWRCGHHCGHGLLPAGHHPAAHADEGRDVQQPGGGWARRGQRWHWSRVLPNACGLAVVWLQAMAWRSQAGTAGVGWQALPQYLHMARAAPAAAKRRPALSWPVSSPRPIAYSAPCLHAILLP